MLLPALGSARENGRSAACMGNLRQLGLCFASYCDSYNDYAPSAYDNWNSQVFWPKRFVLDGTANLKLFHCPSEPVPVTSVEPGDIGHVSYGHNYYSFGLAWDAPDASNSSRGPFKTSAYRSPSQVVALADSTPGDYSTIGTNGGQFIDSKSLVSGNHIYPLCGSGVWYAVYIRHNQRANTVFLDGHVTKQGVSELRRVTDNWLPWYKAGGLSYEEWP